jgi:hypothetical protein
LDQEGSKDTEGVHRQRYEDRFHVGHWQSARYRSADCNGNRADNYLATDRLAIVPEAAPHQWKQEAVPEI